MLIGTSTEMTYKEVRHGLGDVSVGDYQPIYDSEQVCKYVTKYIGHNIDYDFIFKKIPKSFHPTHYQIQGRGF
jgi:hypothetical protein